MIPYDKLELIIEKPNGDSLSKILEGEPKAMNEKYGVKPFIIDVDELCRDNNLDPDIYEYYMRRGATHYFRNYYGKVKMDLPARATELMAQLKYGAMITIHFE